MTDDLAAWLLERIAEDERAAREVSAVELAGAIVPGTNGGVGPQWDAKEGMVARWDPARVLAECDAKRRILARHAPRVGTEYGPFEGELICGCSDGSDEFHAVPWPCADVRDMTSVFADHPGYREEWKP